MIGAITLVAFVMLAAILVVALGPIPGVVAWLLCLAVVRAALLRLRKHVWGQSFNK